MNTKMHVSHRARRGAALVYVVVIVTVMMGLCSMAVDLGRYEVAHGQLYNAAVAAARAGAAAMAQGQSSSQVATAINNAAIANSVDGQSITTSMVTIQYLQWNTTTNTGGSPTTFATATASPTSSTAAPAVRVYISYTVPLAFAQVLGLASKQAVESSTAAVITQVDTPMVYATGNPWLAGEPAGTQASQPDPGYSSSNPNSDHLYKYDKAGTAGKDTNGGTASTSTYSSYEPYNSPAQVAFTVTPGAHITITFPNGTGSVSWDHDTSPWTDPTGNTGTTGNYSNAAANGVSEHGIADVTMPLGSMVGVFLGSSAPDGIATVPAPLDFSTQAERDYVGLEPQLQQPFYAGSGQTSNSLQQQILVPANATRLYFGIMDGWEWSNNNGSFTPTVTQTQILTVQ